MKPIRQLTLAAAVSLSSAAYTGNAVADVIWSFDSSNCVATIGPIGKCGDSKFSTSRTYQGSGPDAIDLDVTGWANTANGSAGNNTALELGMITQYGGGLGVRNSDAGNGDNNEGGSPEHAVDNNQRYDLVLFDFGAGNSVALSDIQIGWHSGDADVNLLAYQGGLGDTPMLDGVEFHATGEGLSANGWTHIGDYDLAPVDGAINVDPDGPGGALEPVSSRYWIVAAHNSVFGDNCANDSNGCPTLNDHFKIRSVSGSITPPPPPPVTTNEVPVPAPLALFGIGLAVLAVRRRRA